MLTFKRTTLLLLYHVSIKTTAEVGGCMTMTTISFKKTLSKKKKNNFAAKKQVSVSVLLQVQGVVRCKPCEHLSVYDVHRISRCFDTCQEDRC